MNCRETELLLAGRSLHDLLPDQRGKVREHLAECRPCRERFGAVYESAVLSEAARPRREPSAIKDGVMSRIRGETTRPSCSARDGEPALPGRIGGFEVMGVLGRGGMGTVLKARQVSMDRVVALKTLSQRLAPDEGFVSRFIREAHAAAKLRHPHIVQAFDAGVADGYYYFAMEYVDGEGLDEILAREGHVEPSRALQIMKQTCSALWAAHEAGIVHRDIKPSNIMLDSKGDVRVADFGLAKCSDAAVPATGDTTGACDAPTARGDATMTARGQMLGTPAYVAPEVAKGLPADARSDLYSLGATFFHVLTGRPPFEGREITEVVIKQVREAPPATADVAPQLDPHLCRILDRMLQKDPAARPASARALLEELDALGPLQSADEAARAEGIALIRSAPTVPLPESRRLQRRLALEALQGRRWGGKRAAMACAGIAAILTIGILALTRPWGRTREAGVAVAPDRVSTKAVTFTDPREESAEALLRDARASAGLGEWAAVKEQLRRLDEEYSDTKLYQEQIVAIGGLRAKADAALLPASPTVQGIADRPGIAGVRPVLPGQPDEWVPLFNGADLAGWRVVEQFLVEAQHGDGKGGKVHVENGQLAFETGRPATGIRWMGEFPMADYEVALEVMHRSDPDAFGIVFPIGRTHCELLAGGFGGAVAALNVVDDRWGNGNVTTRRMQFPRGVWYSVRLRVTDPRIEAWVNEDKVIDLATAGHTLTTPSDRDPLRSLGLYTWGTSSVVRNVRMQRVPAQAAPLVAEPEPPGLRPKVGEWAAMFDGQTLNGWEAAQDAEFAGHGHVHVADGRLMLGRGRPLTGIAWTGKFPKDDYEVSLQAMRTSGEHDFASLTIPIGDAYCCFQMGASLDASLVGLSNVDGRRVEDGENVTRREVPFKNGQWYKIRLLVTEGRITAWIDDNKVTDLATAGHVFTHHDGVIPLAPFGIHSWDAISAVREIRVRQLKGDPAIEVPAPRQAPTAPGEWVPLYKPGALTGWYVAKCGRFAKHGRVHPVGETIVLEPGAPATGVLCKRPFPTQGYEVAFEVSREQGLNHAHVLFPAGDSHSILNLGGWGGNVVGLSLVDGDWAPGNGTARNVAFVNGKWYPVRLRVTEERIQTWVDDEQVINLPRVGRTLAPANWPREEMGFCLSNWESRSAFRNVRVRPLGPEAQRALVAEPEPPKLPERPSDWFALFDGKSLGGWRVVKGGGFAGHGLVHATDDRLVLSQGIGRTGIAWSGDFPTTDYEVALELRRDGGNELCEIAFPVGSQWCAWNIGGWGGTGTGLTCLDGIPGDDNDSFRRMAFRTGQWYRARLRVAGGRLECWLDDTKVIDLPTAGRRLSLPGHLPIAQPFGLGSWQTTLSLRHLKLRLLESKPEAPPADGTPLDDAAVAVPSTIEWLDTGLFLDRGKAYEISAAGRWGDRPNTSDGPEGRPATLDTRFPLPGPRWYNLIGRVGAEGAPFHVGESLALTPPQAGRLCLRANDHVLTDNWGSLRVQLRGPMVAAKDAPLLDRFTQALAKVQPTVTGDWVDSGVELQRGDRVLLSTEGAQDAGPAGERLDADGADGLRQRRRAGALLARIGPHGEVHTAGKFHLLEAREAGKLYLAINGAVAAPMLILRRLGRVILPPGGRPAPLPQPADPEGARDRRAPRLPEDLGAEPAEDGADPADPAPRPANPTPFTVTIFGPAEPRPRDPKQQGGPTPRLLATLRGHASWVISVAFSPDGTRLASGGRDATVRLWDTTGKCLHVLRGHAGTVESVAFLGDGKRVVSTGRDGTVRLWDAVKGEPVSILGKHLAVARVVAPFPDGTRVASAGEDQTVRIWDVAAGREARALPCDSPCWGLAVSPDGRDVAALGDRGWIQVWDAATGERKRIFFAQAANGWCLGYSHDGKRLAAAGELSIVRVWDTTTWTLLASLDFGGTARAVAFSPDGQHIAASGGWCKAIRVWDAATYEHVRAIEDQQSEVRALAFSHDGKRLATASFDRTVNLWALGPEPAGAEERPVPKPKGPEPKAGDALAPREPAARAAAEWIWGKTANGLRCSLVPHPAEMRVGHTYVFDIAIENVSDKATYLHFPKHAPAERLTIKTARGDVAPRRPTTDHRPANIRAFFHLIKPGEQLTAQIQGRVACKWTRAADLPADPADRELLLDARGGGHEIGPVGSFTAQLHIAPDAQEAAGDKRLGIEPVWIGTLDSNPVAFRVRRMTAAELDATLRAVTEGTPEEQLDAVEVLKASADRKAVPVLMGVLQKGSGPLHRAAANALAAIQDTSVAPGLLALYERYAGPPDPVNGNYARHLLDAWSALEPDEGKRADLFVKVLASAAAVEVRSSVASRLVHMKHPQRIPALLAAARENNPRMQWAAIDALGWVAHEDAGRVGAQIAPTLIELLKTAPERTVRSRAAAALRRVAHESVVPALVAALKDPNHFVGAAASHSLGELAGPEAIPALEAFAKTAEQKSQADAAKRAIELIKQRHP